MLDRLKFALCVDSARCAIATGAETVEIWRLAQGTAGNPSPTPESKIETDRSPLRGLAIVGTSTALTFHQLGECALWELPAGHTTESRDQHQPATESAEVRDDLPATGEETALQANDATDHADADEEIPVAEEIWSKEVGIEITVVRARTRNHGYADRIAAGGRDGELLLAALENSKGDEPPTFALSPDAHDADVTCLAFSESGERLASGGRDNRIAIWSTRPTDFCEVRAKEATSPSGSAHSDAVEDTDRRTESDASDENDDGSSPSRPRDETPAPDDIVKTERDLDAPKLARETVLEGSKAWPLAVGFSGDGESLASTALDNALYVWDLGANPGLRAVFSGHDNWVTEVVWSPDDTRVATASWDTTVRVVDVAEQIPEYRLDAHNDFVSGLVYLRDPPRLVSASYDGTIAIWNWAEGTLEHQIDAHADWIEHLYALKNGRILTVSSEHILRVWDAESARQLAELGRARIRGFDLGRSVDFSDYAEVPELSSEMLEGDERSDFAIDAVEELEPRESGDRAETDSETAVTLLEDAIETSLQDDPPAELAEGSSETGTDLLEARIDKPDTKEEAERTSDSRTKTVIPDESPQHDTSKSSDPPGSNLGEPFDEMQEPETENSTDTE